MTGSEDAFAKLMNQGHTAAWEQQWGKAAEYYRMALQEIPDHPKALVNLGLALLEMQQYPEALTCYRQAALATPEDPMPMERSSQLYERMGQLREASSAALQAAELYLKNRDIEKAIENWVRVIQFQPTHIAVRSRLAMTYERLNRKSEAVKEFLAVAALLQHAGDAARAAQAVNYALQMQPENKEAREAATILRTNQVLPKPGRPPSGSTSGSLRQLEGSRQAQLKEGKGIEILDPVALGRKKALAILAGILFDQADHGEDVSTRRDFSAITHGTGGDLDSAEGRRTKMILHLGQAVDANSQGMTDEAAVEIQQAIENGLDNLSAYYLFGCLRYDRGQHAEALMALREAATGKDFALGAHLLMGSSLVKLNRLGEAAHEFLEALKLADTTTLPTSQAEALQQQYEPLIEAQEHQDDESVLKAICDNIAAQLMRPDWQQYLKNARLQLPPTARNAPPTPLAEILLEPNSNQVVESLMKIRSLAERNLVHTAMEEAFYLLQFAPTYLPLHLQIAEMLIKDGHIPAAVEKLLIVARTYNIRNEPEQANRLMRRVIQLNPTDFNVRNQFIDQLISQKQINEAMQEYMDLGEIYYRSAELDIARQTFMSALRLCQKSNVGSKWTVQILRRMAEIDLQRLDWRQALRVYEQVRNLEPQDEKVRFSLVDLNFRLGQDIQAFGEIDNFCAFLTGNNIPKAIAFLNSMAEEYPDKAEVSTRLAGLYQRAGQMPKALEVLDKAGDYLISKGNLSGAAAVIQLIISYNPPNKEDYQQLLHSLQK
jgi:tetratricopeptide (TPR) repeat protein